MSPSDKPLNTDESCQSFIFKLTESTSSPFPFPPSPWHIAQSYPKIFFAAASTSGDDFTGFSFFTAAVADEAVAGVAAVDAVVAATGVSAGFSCAFSCAFSCTLQTPTAIATPIPNTCKMLLMSASQGNFPVCLFRAHLPLRSYVRDPCDGIYTRAARLAQKRFQVMQKSNRLFMECGSPAAAFLSFESASYRYSKSRQFGPVPISTASGT